MYLLRCKNLGFKKGISVKKKKPWGYFKNSLNIGAKMKQNWLNLEKKQTFGAKA